MIRLAVVDDHPIGRRGVIEVLAEMPEAEVVASVADPGELPPGEDLDVVILDLAWDLTPDQPSAEVVKVVTQLARRARVLVMSASGSPADMLECIEAGASGYFMKSSHPEMLASAVSVVAAGGFALGAEPAGVLRSELVQAGACLPQARGRQGDDPSCLAPREEEALRHIAEGCTHAEAARRMGLSKSTVDTYVEHVRVKLQVGNKAELTRIALTRTRPGAWSSEL